MDLRTLAADAKHDFAALDPSRPVTLTGPDGGPAASAPVLGDEARLRQVVSNLVGNAVTHTPAGTPVRIGVGTVGAEAVLVIEDSGPGLSTEEAARAFDRFYRADTSRARSDGRRGPRPGHRPLHRHRPRRPRGDPLGPGPGRDLPDPAAGRHTMRHRCEGRFLLDGRSLDPPRHTSTAPRAGGAVREKEDYLRLFTSSASCGTTWCRSPTTP